MTGESSQLCFLLPRWLLGHLLPDSGGTGQDSKLHAYTDPGRRTGIQKAIDTYRWSPENRTPLCLPSKQPHCQHPNSRYSCKCMGRAVFPQFFGVSRGATFPTITEAWVSPPATEKLLFALPCFLHLCTLKHRKFKSEIVTHPNYEEVNRSDGQYSVNKEMKSAEERYSQDLLFQFQFSTGAGKLNSIAGLSHFCHLPCFFIKC